MDSETLEALQDFKRRLELRFGDRPKGVYLFGSCARESWARQRRRRGGSAGCKITSGTEFLEDTYDPAYDASLERGLHIQSWTLEHSSLENPSAFWAEQLVQTVTRERKRI